MSYIVNKTLKSSILQLNPSSSSFFIYCAWLPCILGGTASSKKGSSRFRSGPLSPDYRSVLFAWDEHVLDFFS